MSWTVGGTTVANPSYPDGIDKSDEPIGKVFESLDGSLVPLKIATRKTWRVKWRVIGTAYTTLIGALRALHLATGTVIDHESNSETMTISDPIGDKHGPAGIHDVSCTFRETTA